MAQAIDGKNFVDISKPEDFNKWLDMHGIKNYDEELIKEYVFGRNGFVDNEISVDKFKNCAIVYQMQSKLGFDNISLAFDAARTKRIEDREMDRVFGQ